MFFEEFAEGEYIAVPHHTGYIFDTFVGTHQQFLRLPQFYRLNQVLAGHMKFFHNYTADLPLGDVHMFRNINCAYIILDIAIDKHDHFFNA